MRALAVAAGMLVVAVGHVVLGCALYRSRVVDKSDHSDFVVFFLPFLAAAVAYGGLLWRAAFLSSNLQVRVAVTVAVAVVAAIVWPGRLPQFAIGGSRPKRCRWN